MGQEVADIQRMGLLVCLRPPHDAPAVVGRHQRQRGQAGDRDHRTDGARIDEEPEPGQEGRARHRRPGQVAPLDPLDGVADAGQFVDPRGGGAQLCGIRIADARQELGQRQALRLCHGTMTILPTTSRRLNLPKAVFQSASRKTSETCGLSPPCFQTPSAAFMARSRSAAPPAR